MTWSEHERGLSRRTLIVRGAGLAAGTSLLGAAASCSDDQATTTSSTPKRGGTLQVAVEGVSTSENLDPLHNWNTNEWFYLGAIHEALTDADENWNVKPQLAEAWEPNADITKWTFTMRRGVRFHDGDPFTAEDAAYSLSRHVDEELGSSYYATWSKFLDPDGIKAVNDRTLVLSLKRPCSVVPLLLARGPMRIVRAGTRDFTKEANGTGPFKLASFRPGQSWEVERNQKYWRSSLPYLDGIRGVAVSDPAAKMESVLSGDTDFADPIEFSLARSVEQSPNAELLRRKGGVDLQILLDTRKRPFDDNRVRTAIKLATDRELILKTAYRGYGVPTSDTAVPSTDVFYPSELGIREQRIAEARRLLADAGYPDGIEIELHTAPIVGGIVDVCVAFAKTVEPAGIRVSLKRSAADTYFEQVWGQVPMFVNWDLRTHPGIALGIYFTSDAPWQQTHLADTDGSPVDDLLAKALGARDTEQQQPYYREALTFISENEGYLSSAFSDFLFLKKKRVQGIKVTAGGQLHWDKAYLAS